MTTENGKFKMISSKTYRSCPCGSGLPRRALHDTRGIFCTFICDSCEAKRRSGFRQDIFTDVNYWHDEPIDDD